MDNTQRVSGSVQGNVGPQPVSPLVAMEATLTALLGAVSTETTLTTLLAVMSQAQGAAAAGVTGPLVQALVSDVSPAVTDGTLAPLSLNGEGRLRVTTELARVEFMNPACWAERCPSFFASPW